MSVRSAGAHRPAGRDDDDDEVASLLVALDFCCCLLFFFLLLALISGLPSSTRCRIRGKTRWTSKYC